MAAKTKRAAKANPLPKVIYAHWHEEGTRDEFLRTDSDPQALVDTGETRRVGVYKLAGYADVKNTTEVTVSVTAKR